jgi:hypothetical protein
VPRWLIACLILATSVRSRLGTFEAPAAVPALVWPAVAAWSAAAVPVAARAGTASNAPASSVVSLRGTVPPP